jgi:putative endopeptidase
MPQSRVIRLLASAALSITAGPALADETPAAASAGDWGRFGVQTQWMNTTVKPGDDFDAYMNGKWNETVEIPADKTRIGAFIGLRDLSEERLHGILDELVASKPAAGTPEARIAASYSAFMNTDAIEAAGMAPARPYLDRIYAARSTDDLVKLFGLPGYASPIGASVDPDEKQSDRYALHLYQGGLGLPDRDYYLVDSPRYRDIQTKYRAYLAFLLGKAGYEDPKTAADAVYALEADMARASWDRATQRNADLMYNKLSAAELDQLAPAGMMRAFLDSLGAGTPSETIVAQLPPTADELAKAKITPAVAATKLGGGVPATFKLVAERPLATWQAWLVAHFLSAHAGFLPKEIDDANFAFYGTTLRGQPQQRARWKRGIETVEGQIGELLGRIYAERYFPPENKAAMADLVGNLRKAMAANLADLKWMGPETR